MLVADGAIAGSHRREMAQRHFGIRRRHRGQNVFRLRVERAFAVVNQQAERSAREHFGERPDAVDFINVVAVPDHPAIANDHEFVNTVAADSAIKQCYGFVQLCAVHALRFGRGDLPILSWKNRSGRFLRLIEKDNRAELGNGPHVGPSVVIHIRCAQRRDNQQRHDTRHSDGSQGNGFQFHLRSGFHRLPVRVQLHATGNGLGDRADLCAVGVRDVLRARAVARRAEHHEPSIGRK